MQKDKLYLLPGKEGPTWVHLNQRTTIWIAPPLIWKFPPLVFPNNPTRWVPAGTWSTCVKLMGAHILQFAAYVWKLLNPKSALPDTGGCVSSQKKERPTHGLPWSAPVYSIWPLAMHSTVAGPSMFTCRPVGVQSLLATVAVAQFFFLL